MPLNAPLLRSSFELVVSRRPDLTDRFYELLFAAHPGARPLFGKNSIAAQSQMLTAALVAVMDHLEDSPWLVQTLGALGARHAGAWVDAYGAIAGLMQAGAGAPS